MTKGPVTFMMLGLCLGLAVAVEPETNAPLAGPSGTTCVNSGKCVGQPDGTLFADPNSTGYIVCQCECEIAMPCAPGTAFNETLQTCDHIGCGNGSGDCGSGGAGNGGDGGTGGGSTGGGNDGGGNTGSGNDGPSTGPSGTTCVNSGKCVGQPDGTLFADPNSTGYIVCQCECQIAMPCAPGTAFNETLQTCDHIGCGNGSGDCGSGGGGNGGDGGTGGGNGGDGGTGGGNDGPSTGPSGTTCVNSGKCVGQPDGTLFADPNSTGYIVCQCECEIAMSCAPGTAFNETLQTCDHIGCGNGSGDCGSGGGGNGGDGGTGGGSTGGGNDGGGNTGSGNDGPSTGPSGTTCVNSGKCVGQPDGTLFADPNSTGYIVCQCECQIAMPCAPGTAFNETLQTCDHIGCGNGSGDCGSGGGGNGGDGGTGGGSTGGGNDGGGNTGSGNDGPSTGPSGTTCVNSGKCVGQPDGTLFADPNSTGYIVCQCECQIAMPCAPGTAFNETLQTCDHIGCGNGSGDCGSGGGGNGGDGGTGGGSTGGGNDGGGNTGSGNDGPSTGPSGTTCVNSGKCVGQPDGTLFADPNSTGYIVCQCECQIAMPCAPGTAFNETLQTCDHIGCGNGSGDCGSGGGGNGGDGGTGGGSTGGGNDGGGNTGSGNDGPSTGPSGTTCVNSGKCVGQPDGTLFADPNSTGYIVCQCECEIAMSCAPGTAFSETLQTCDHIGCGNGSGDCGSGGGGNGGDGGTGGGNGGDGGTGGGNDGPSTGPSGTTCVNSGKCVGQLDGTLFADPNSTGYIVCQCECEIAMPCAPGTAFSETLQTCDHIGCGKTGKCFTGN